MSRPAARWWFGAVLRLYPRRFRTAVGPDLLRLLEDQARDRRREGRMAWTWYVGRQTAVCLRDAAAEWGGSLVGTASHGKTGGGGMGGDGSMRDLRIAARGLVRRPAYTLPVLLTLALGVGASTSMFAVLDRVLLAPLPYPTPDRLVEVHPADPARGVTSGAFSLPDALDWEQGTRTLAHFAAYTTLPSDIVILDDGRAEEVETAYVTPDFFHVLGTRPALGRVFGPEDDAADNRVLVVSHDLWIRRWGGDAGVVGTTVRTAEGDYRLIGVAPPETALPAPDVEAWVPISVIPASSIPLQYRGVRLLAGLGRLAPGVGLEDAAAELGALARTLSETYPESNGTLPGAVVRPLQDVIVGDVRSALILLGAASGVVLILVCANLVNLALIREEERAPEMAVRAALGAGRGLRTRLVLTEGVLLAVAGGALGLASATWGTRLLAAASAGVLPRAREIGVAWPALTLGVAATVVAGAALTLLPGLRAGATSPPDPSAMSGRRTTRSVGRGGLVASQVALAVVLLIGAGLVARSLAALGRVDPGFEPQGLVVADLTFKGSRFPERADYLARYDATLEALAALPGAQGAGSIRRFPFLGEGERIDWAVPGAPAPGRTTAAAGEARLLQVSPNLFEVIGAPMVAGAGFGPRAGRDGPPTAVVNGALAGVLAPGGSAVGRVLVLDGTDVEIVGVVQDIRQTGLDGPVPPTVYLPQHVNPRRGAAFVVRVDGPAVGALQDVRSALNTLDAQQAVTVLSTAEAIARGPMARPRFFSLILALFAGLALALSTVGVYGVVSFTVARRRREMGIRMAVGAGAARVAGEVLGRGMRPVAVGLAVGGVAALLGVRAVDSLLFGVGRYDPVAYLTALVGIGAVAAVACAIPAMRAAGTAPAEVLGSE